MNRRNIRVKLKQELIDALDETPGKEALARLEKKVKAHDPDLWEDFQWFSAQQKKHGVFGELAAMRHDEPDDKAIRRLHRKLAVEYETGADLESLVWAFFRRYVLTTGILLIILFTGLQMGHNGVSEAGGREQVETFLGWTQEELPEPDYWLYDDL